jgi:hypothetical protein
MLVQGLAAADTAAAALHKLFVMTLPNTAASLAASASVSTHALCTAR